MTAARLTPLDRRIYQGIARYAFDEAICWPSQARVARDLGITREAVNRAVRRLAAAGWLEVQKRRRTNARWDHNIYVLLANFTVATTAARAITRAAHRRAKAIAERVRARVGAGDHTNYSVGGYGVQWCACPSCRPTRKSPRDAERFLAEFRLRLDSRDEDSGRSDYTPPTSVRDPWGVK